MPRATELHLRLALAHLARLGTSASGIARQLGLPVSTVRGLVQRLSQTGTDPSPAEWY
jgi:DNA-binding IclR family transcriptional regulator